MTQPQALGRVDDHDPTDTGTPLVSAIVTAYNYARFLPRALDSALSQNYPADKLEILVVDDGSTDSTPAILEDYARRYPGRIRAFRQKNSGFVAATNLAFSKARGDLWALLDADDVWPREKTIRQVELMQRNPRVGAVYADMAEIDQHDQVLGTSVWTRLNVVPVRGPGALAPLLVNGNCATASGLMFRATLRERFDPIPGGVPYVDWWVIAQIAAVTDVDYVPGVRVGYRLHDSNMTHGVQGARWVREQVRHSSARRHVLIHGGAAALPAHALIPAWQAFEHAALEAIQAAGSAYVPLPETTELEQATAQRAARRARVLQRRGVLEPALRAWVLAAANNPFDAEARESIAQVAVALAGSQRPEHPFAAARSFVVLARAEELASAPSLLAAFAQTFDSDDDATLFIHGPGADGEHLGRLLAGAIEAAGVDVDGPDLLAQADPESLLDPQVLQEAADLVLTHDTAPTLREHYDETLDLLRPPALVV
ncbi:MAG TPA: glycosyltransferase [Solirubrobacteraceae bacterium]|nr:glycosyltransferase [Solirubrobacteraceae bacterium]